MILTPGLLAQAAAACALDLNGPAGATVPPTGEGPATVTERARQIKLLSVLPTQQADAIATCQPECDQSRGRRDRDASLSLRFNGRDFKVALATPRGAASLPPS
jgi:hypothetical protein